MELIFAGFLSTVCVLGFLIAIGYTLYKAFKGAIINACIGLIVIAFFLYWSVVNLAWVSVILQWGS